RGRAFGGASRIRPAGSLAPYAPAFGVNASGLQLVAVPEALNRAALVGLFRGPDGTVTETAVLDDGSPPRGDIAPQVALDRDGRGTVAYVKGEELRLVPARPDG
ncbi:MAG: hypothetical protein M3340_05125, partial [Actinomycetota bacterium]|nr:hypothetical protein [Actinomycetota bacterium]